MPGKRQKTSSSKYSIVENGSTSGVHSTAAPVEKNGVHFTAAPEVNDDQDRVKFAYWVPNVSGGLVISKIPQRT